MAKKKVSELEGADLDYRVAQAEGKYPVMLVLDCMPPHYSVLVDGKSYSPSTDWSQGGPIIERARIIVLECLIDEAKVFEAMTNEYCDYNHMIRGDFMQYGATYLIAAMRCFVASKFGEEVEAE
jgi:hypothetical protein